MADFPVGDLNRVRRLPDRGRYDRDTIYQVIDEALYCHVGFVDDGRPFVIPLNHARIGDTLVLHGARASRLLKHVEAGNLVCVAITLLDGLVLARAAANHSLNFRSVVLFGTGRAVEADEERLAALEAITEHIAPGRWAEVRKPTAAEIRGTRIVAISIEEASAKVRSGPPKDAEDDYDLPVWAGVLPVQMLPSAPVEDAHLRPGVALPDYLAHYDRQRKAAGKQEGDTQHG